MGVGAGKRRRDHQRASNPPGLVKTLKDEIVDVISSHVAADADNVLASLSYRVRESRLAADKPLVLRGR